MNIADKIKKFDQTIPANVKQLEELFRIKLDDSHNPSNLVEILEPIQGGRRKILVNEVEYIVDLNPVVDNASQESLYSNGRNFYKYTARCPKGKVIAEAYSLSEISKELNITVPTTINIMRRGNSAPKKTGRPRNEITIERKSLYGKEDRRLVTKNTKRFYFIITKDGEQIGRFKGASEAAKFLKVSDATIINYSQGKTKNKDGYKVTKELIK